MSENETSSDVATDLLPCPFCGSKKVGIAASQEMADGKYIEEGREWSVLCGNCGSSCSLYCESALEAEKSWNVRADTCSPLVTAALQAASNFVITDPKNQDAINIRILARRAWLAYDNDIGRAK